MVQRGITSSQPSALALYLATHMDYIHHQTAQPICPHGVFVFCMWPNKPNFFSINSMTYKLVSSFTQTRNICVTIMTTEGSPKKAAVVDLAPLYLIRLEEGCLRGRFRHFFFLLPELKRMGPVWWRGNWLIKTHSHLQGGLAWPHPLGLLCCWWRWGFGQIKGSEGWAEGNNRGREDAGSQEF